MKKLISIIIPTHNEEKNIPLIYRDILDLWKDLDNKYVYEMIFVNDGSNDGSWLEIKRIAQKNLAVKGISLSRNFGHQAAIEAGLKKSEGDAIIMLDCDGQHPVFVIKKLMRKWQDGADIVNTLRRDNKHTSWFKKISSKLFYSFINFFSEVKIQPGAADFRLLDKKIVDIINDLPERDKFYRGLVRWVGYKTAYVEYNAKDRLHGKSSYTFRKMMSLARVGVTSFSLLPLKIIISLGLFITLGSAVTLVVMFYFRWFVNHLFFSSSAFLAVIVVFSNGIILTVIGIIALYLVTIYKEIQGRPTYLIEESINL